ncbi:hypothetical protein BGX27_010875 [Mortierella sp. AM989]|nr:hypothetical protein BGX27_010875 [Mortierella sp. AM989]
MCSNIKLRLLTSRTINPEAFKHITLHLDGHDSHVTYINADKPSMYSYKLKKSGFHTQVCHDINSMVVFVSQLAECRDFNDGTMLSKMAIEKKIHELDCIALDGGYTQFIEGIITSSSGGLKSSNFCCPVRKPKGICLTEGEKKYSEMLGSLRSKIESYFGDMQNTFTKFSHTVVNRFSEKSIFSLQFKLCCLLLNIKRMVALRNIVPEAHHSAWVQEDFEFPDGTSSVGLIGNTPSYRAKIKDAQNLLKMQEAFLSLAFAPNTDREIGDNAEEPVYEVSKIIGHRGEGDAIEFHVLWKGYDMRPEAALRGFDEYAVQAEAYRNKTGVSDVYLMTDDQVAIDATRNYPNFQFQYLSLKKTNHGWADDVNHGVSLDVQEKNFLLDVLSAAQCDHKIVTYSSNVGRLIGELSYAAHDVEPDVVSLDTEWVMNP